MAGSLRSDQRVFFFTQKDGWDLGVVKDVSHITQGTITIGNAANPRDSLEVPVKHVYIAKTTFALHEAEPPDDLLQLPELHHAILLHTLRRRHQSDYCYTYLGDLIVALNPFRYTIPHYLPSMMQKYLDCIGKPSIAAATHGQLRPHHWALAHRVYHHMMAHRRNQTVIISGESGSGKTEGCKMVLSYLCHLSEARQAALHAAHVHGEGVNRINETVQQSNPILEAFGNAKTARNDNSSRFGKLMEVQFDADGILVGMRITVYLLEKLRVVTAAQNERLYHSFYLLAFGAPEAVRLKYGIKRAKDFRVLNSGGCTMVRGIDEHKGFEELTKAFTDVGLTEFEIDQVWRVVAAILHLQNVDFVPANVSKLSARAKAFGGDGAQTDGDATIDQPCVEMVQFVATELLSVDPAQLSAALVSSPIVVRGETTHKNLSKHKCEEQRDTLCKHLYTKLFFWIVERINDSIASAAAVESPGGSSSTFVALLDIFGFEDFERNSLEQLCINLANEALQRHYAKHIFERDRDEVAAEGVTCDEVHFRDNQPCVELIQGDKESIFTMLDDASTLDLEHSQTDPNRTLLDRVTAKFKPEFSSSGAKGTKSVLDRNPDEMRAPGDFFSRLQTEHDSFTVRHYAADVRYQVAGFVQKNTDVLKENLKSLFMTSESAVVRAVVATPTDGDGDVAAGGSPAGASANRLSSFASPTSPRGGVKLFKSSAVSQFRRSLRDLLRTVDNTEPSWIRCIRPHPKKEPGAFDGKSVLEQLVATGVLETIEQRQRTFPIRMPLSDFVHQYGLLAGSVHRPGLRAVRKVPLHEMSNNILITVGGFGSRARGSEAQVGKTKVFLSSAAFERIDGEARKKLHQHAATLIRFCLARESRSVVSWIRLTKAAKKCQRIRRAHRCMKMLHSAALEAIRRKIEAAHVAAQTMVSQEETLDRRDVGTAEQLERSKAVQVFLKALVPMISVVLKNIQAVETSVRAQFTAVTEPEARATLAALESRGAKESAQRRDARIARQQAERWALMKDLLGQKEVSVATEASLEASARSAITRQWLPVKQHIETLWRRAELLRHERDRHVEALTRERDRELARLARLEETKALREASLWKARCGGVDGVRADCDYLTRNVGLSQDVAATQLARYLQHGGPSRSLLTGGEFRGAAPGHAMRTPNDTSGRNSFTSPPTPVRQSASDFRSPRSVDPTAAMGAPLRSPPPKYKGAASYSEYAAGWRAEFDAAVATGVAPRYAPSQPASPAGADASRARGSEGRASPAYTAGTVRELLLQHPPSTCGLPSPPPSRIASRGGAHQ